MNRYLVIWSIDALDTLASIWMEHSDRDEITQAQTHVDVILADDPRKLGREAAEGLWKLTIPPLVVLYEIDDAGGVVRITGAGHVP